MTCLTEYPDYQQFMDELSLVEPLLDTDRKTMFLDVFSGANAPLAKAFLQCQWEIVTPIDIESSLQWWGPVELYATEQGAWRDLD